jgi:outer membrane protein OmpA-like peptidoglycan-associated protein
MEMKKKVLSFDEFIFESYDIVNEAGGGLSLKQLQSRIQGGDQANKALAMVEDLFKGSKNPKYISDTIVDRFSKDLDKMDKRGKYETQVTSNEIVLDSVLQGKVYTRSAQTLKAMSGYLKMPNYNDLSSNSMNDVLNILACLNGENIESFNPADIDSKKKRLHSYDDKKEIVNNSGISKQRILIKEKGGITIERALVSKGAVPSDMNKEGLEGVEFTKWDKEKKDADYTMMFYVIKDIEPGAGSPMKASTLVEEEIPVGGDVTVKLEILNGDPENPVLFDQNKSILKEAGKKNILASLGQFTKISSIVVTGGASQEGSEERNKELCKLRASAVAEYLKTISKAKIEAKDEGVIQPKEDKSDRKSWRRVILEVKGETSVPNTDKEIVYNTSVDEINADKYTIAQIAMNFKFTYEG